MVAPTPRQLSASSYSTSPLSYHDANVNFAVERRVIIAVYRGCCQKSCLAYHKPVTAQAREKKRNWGQGITIVPISVYLLL
ncbi:unnamed protein product [Fusarium graminearum]|nr:unnamed protein product [Fusarium graminearum]VTO87237.1 unnamed protein product [Fusarium graminearum]